MTFLLSLLLRTGLSPKAALLVGRGLVTVAVFAACVSAWHYAYAKPRVERDLAVAELATATAELANWKQAASLCSAATDQAAADGTARTTRAEAAADAALLTAPKLPQGSGPDAMTRYFDALYRP